LLVQRFRAESLYSFFRDPADDDGFRGKTVKRFVAEYVSGTCDTIPDTNITRISIIHGFPDGGTGLGHYFVPVSVPGPPGFGNYDFAQQTRIYGNPGDRMILGLSYWGSGNYSCLMYVSGYLVTQ